MWLLKFLNDGSDYIKTNSALICNQLVANYVIIKLFNGLLFNEALVFQT